MKAKAIKPITPITRVLLFFKVTILFIFFFAFANVKAQYVNIPDANFKSWVLANVNHSISTSDITYAEAAAFKSKVDLTSLSIGNLSGIEAFINIDSLDCTSNKLTTINVSSNKSLKYLNCNDNQIQSLDVSANTFLTDLIIPNNYQLTSINLSNNNSLTNFDCRFTGITSLDFSQNPLLKSVYCNNAQLTTVNLKNGHNSNLTFLSAASNPHLFCIEVDDIFYANAHWYTGIDTNTTIFGSGCTNYISIPDNNFKKGLIASVTHPSNPYAITYLEAASYAGSVNVSSQSIKNLTGIEYFTNIKSLDCSSNQLSTINVSSNNALIYLNCGGNQLASLDVSNDSLLKILYCANNKISNLNLTSNLKLTELDCRANTLSNLDVSKNTGLAKLLCSFNNQLSNLNLTKNTALTSFQCYGCGLTQLDIRNGRNQQINDFLASNNPLLSCINVDDLAYFNTNWSSAIDATSIFSTNCAMYVYIPDDNFKTWILNNVPHPSDNNRITYTEAAAYTGSITAVALSISDFTGIEAFTNITKLDCRNNKITSLNLSNNSHLTYLSCSSNPSLASINIHSCSLLNYLDISGDSLTSIDLSGNVSLTSLNCNSTVLPSLDLTNNTLLKNLYCTNASLKSLDLTKNTKLTYIDCRGNSLSSLDLSMNTALSTLLCSYNFKLSGLDLSKNTSLISLQATTCGLIFLDLRNGHNQQLIDFLATNNASLTCISVDDIALFNSKWSSVIDATALFSNNCAMYVDIPDANFKNWVLKNVSHPSNATRITYTEAAAFKANIAVASLSISSLKGIEAFTNVAYLDCSNNQIANLDISQNTALTYLNCSNNPLTSINVTYNILLNSMNSSSTMLSDLDLTNNVLLKYLDCNSNSLSSLRLPSKAPMTYINCSKNSLSLLDLSGFTSLNNLNCSSNSFSWLDLSLNIAIDSFNCSNNSNLWVLNLQNRNNTKLNYLNALNNPNLTCINVDNVSYSNAKWSNSKDISASFSTGCLIGYVNIPDSNFKAWILANVPHSTNNKEITIAEASAFKGKLNIASKSITDLTGLNAFYNIDSLDCSYNKLASLDVSSNPNLVYLNCSGNGFQNLNISSNTFIKYLDCSNISIIYNPDQYYGYFSLTLNADIIFLNCSNSMMASLDVSNCKMLTYLNCSDNSHGLGSYTHTIFGEFSLKLSGATSLSYLDCHNCAANTVLGLYGIPSLTYLNCSNCRFTSLDVSQLPLLKYLNCSYNYSKDNTFYGLLTNLDVSKNTFLNYLDCSNVTYWQQLLPFSYRSNLNLSKNKELTYLNCNGYDLDTLDLRNGNNSNLTLNSKNNSVIKCFMVDTVANAYKFVDSGKWVIDSFINFSLNCASTVPLTLVSFEANIAKAQTVALKWISDNEVSTALFTVETSKDGISFKEIGNVVAKGNGKNSYGFIDINPIMGINYYRLKMKDKDGSFTYSKVVLVQLNVNQLPFTVVPNPAQDIVTIKGDNIATIQLIDNIGRVVKVVSFKDATNPTLSVSKLPVGFYHIRVQSIDGKVSNVGMVKE